MSGTTTGRRPSRARPTKRLAPPEAGDRRRVVGGHAEVMVGRAQLARLVVEEVDAARFEVQGVEGGAQRVREGALEVFRVGERGGDGRECGEASRLAVPLRRPDARHNVSGGALAHDRDGPSPRRAGP